MPRPSRRSLLSKPTKLTAFVSAGLLAAGLAAPVAQAAVGAVAGAAGTPITESGPEPFTQEATGLADLDTRGWVYPTSAQKSAVPSGATVRWNSFGTPSSLMNRSGYLSPAHSGSATTVARDWLAGHRAVLGLSSSQVSSLQVINDSQLRQSQAHVVRFRQQLGNAVPAIGGMVNVAVDPNGRVSYVSSSLTRNTSGVSGASISAVTAWSKAVSELRSKHAPGIPSVDLDGVVAKTVGGWSTFSVPGFAQKQQVRLRALALPGKSSRPVFETNVVNSAAGTAAAYTSYVDAVSGDVLVRHSRVDNLSDAPMMATNSTEPFNGTITATECGADHHFTVDAATKTITVAASALAPDEDIVLKLYAPGGGSPVASADTATSPEAINYSPAGGIAAGQYTVKVCPFSPDPTAPVVVGQYAGFFVASEQGSPQASTPYPPQWKYFTANPALDYGSEHDRHPHGRLLDQGRRLLDPAVAAAEPRRPRAVGRRPDHRAADQHHERQRSVHG